MGYALRVDALNPGRITHLSVFHFSRARSLAFFPLSRPGAHRASRAIIVDHREHRRRDVRVRLPVRTHMMGLGGLRGQQPQRGSTHSSTSSPGTRANSRVLAVTMVSPWAMQVAANQRSWGPMRVPAVPRTAHTCA